MKLLKRLVWMVLAIAALLVAAIIIIPQFIDPNDYKDQITQLVKKHTGQDLRIDGDLSLSVFPWLGVSTGALSLSQPASVATGELISIASADIRVKLLPLIKRHVNVDTITLKKPKLTVVITKTGQTSFDAIKADSSPTEPSAQAPSAEPKEPPALAALAIAGLQLIDAEITIDDRQQQKRHQLRGLNIQTGNLLSGEPTSINASAEALLDGQPAIKIKFSGQSQLLLDDLTLANRALTLSLQQNAVSLKAQMASADFNQQRQQFLAKDIDLALDLPQGPATLKLPEITADLKDERIMVPQFAMAFADLAASGKVMLNDWGQTPIYKGELRTESFNPQKLLQQLAIDFTPSDPKVLQKASFTSSFSGSNKGFSLHAIDIKLDESNLQGDMSTMHFDNPSYRFDMSLDSINLDRYMPKVSQQAAGNSTNTKGHINRQALVLPLAAFKSINANGMLRAGKLVASNVTASDIILSVNSQNNRVTLKPKAKLYGGTTGGEIIFTDKGDELTLTIDQAIESVALEPLLTDAGINDQISGQGSVIIDLLITDKKGKQQQSGSVKLLAKDGLFKGLNIKQVLDETQDRYDRFRGKTVKERPANTEDSTAFTEMSTSLNLNDLIIRSDDLSIKAPAFRIGGSGKIDLSSQKINYTSLIKIVRTNTGQSGADAGSLAGVTIPVRFLGTLEEPEYKIDWNRFLKLNVLNKEKDKLREKLTEKLGLTKDAEEPSTTESTEGEKPVSAEEAAKQKLQEELERGLKRLFR